MRTLVIYDNEGFIVSQISGSVREPVGIPFIWVEIPDSKFITSVDVSTTPHVAVLANRPKTETELLKEEITLMQEALNEIIQGGM